jgi:histidyl-tRNA synthetase
MNINSLKGTKDIFWPEIEIWQRIEEISRQIFSRYSYREIRTPIIELTSLFARSIGSSTDIVQKEMYSFKDKGQREICLRPEETASVVRAYIQHSIFRQRKLAKFYYIGPMFRSERPQAGRMRQFHQIGVEAIGSKNPLLDVEIIILLHEILTKVKAKNYVFKINSLGCPDDRKKYKVSLKSAVKPHLKALCTDCKRRYNLNVLRILDCKNKNCCSIITKLPIIRDYLCDRCQEHFDKVIGLLDKYKIPKEIDAYLVRGLDYYTGTTFEVIAKELSGQNAIAAGGRYDKLVAELGGPELGACGFAIGIERLFGCISEKDKHDLKQKKGLFIYIVYFNEETRLRSFEVLSFLRKNGISADMDYSSLGCPSLKSQMRQANTLGAKYTIIIGENEIKNHILTVKNMKSGQQKKITQEELLNFLST